MPTLLALQKKRDDALTAVSQATTTKARASAASDLEAASMELAKFQAKLQAAKEEKADDEPKKPLEDKEEDDDDEEEEDEEEEEEDDDDEDKDKKDDDDDDDEEEEEESDEEDDDDEERCKEKAVASARAAYRSAKASGNASLVKDAKASLSAVKALHGTKSSALSKALKSACQRITGKKSTAAIIGALEGLAGNAKATAKLGQQVAKLQARSRRDRVTSLLASARRDGKITAAQVEQLKGQSPKWLKSYLAVMPKAVHSEPVKGKLLSGGNPSGDGDAAGSSSAALIDAQNLTPEQKKMLEAQAMGAGMEFDAFVESMNKQISKAGSNGTPRN
jgi:hypothetical protein